MNIHTPSAPKRLQITPTMIDDFLIDPVMGAKVIFGAELDVFQAALFRLWWWTPEVMDSSGFSTSKTFRFWLWCNLRCVLLPDQKGVAFYQSLGTAKLTFWSYYTTRFARAPLFRAQIGHFDELGKERKGTRKEASALVCNFRNESQLTLPAPDWKGDADTMASQRYNFGGIDEWTKITKKNEKGIEDQFEGRITRESWNQDHPLWTNHIKYLATAESLNHPAARRYKNFLRRVDKGDPRVAVLTSSYKDYTAKPCYGGKTFKGRFRQEHRLKSMRLSFTRDHALREIFGLWTRSGEGWYSEHAVDRCIAHGKKLGTEAVISQRQAEEIAPELKDSDCIYVEGVDPAPAMSEKSDDGACAVMRARPIRLRKDISAEEREWWRDSDEEADGGLSHNPQDWVCEFVYAYRFRRKSARQWSGKLHQTRDRFGLDGILMDPQGGGYYVLMELDKPRQLFNDIETTSRPITTMEEILPDSHAILNLFKRSDSGVKLLWPDLSGDDLLVDAMHTDFQEPIEHARIAFPTPYQDRTEEERQEIDQTWSDERRWALLVLSEGIEQLQKIEVEMKDDGTWNLTARRAKRFISPKRKDIAYAMIYAYARFLIFLKNLEHGWAVSGESEPVTHIIE